MNTKPIKKWSLRLTLISLVITIIGYFYVDYQLTQMYGGHTKIVDFEQFQMPQETIAIINANVLSQDGTKMLKNKTVLMDKSIIIAIDESITIPKNTRIINAQGKYLIPGLIDSHVHLIQSPNDLLLYIANGVTQVREMMGNQLHLQWRDEIEKGRIGPKLFVASGKLQSQNWLVGWFNHWTRKDINVNTLEKANTILQSLKDEGFDAVKLGSMFAIDKYHMVNEASKSTNIPIIGHFTLAGKLPDLWSGNQKELSHIEELTKALDNEFGGYNSKTADEFLFFVQQRSENIANKLTGNKIAVVSTLNLMESFVKQKHGLNTLFKEIQLPYANPGLTEGTPITSRGLGWLGKVNRYRLNDDYPKDRLEGNKIYWQTYVKAQKILLRDMVHQGVKILAGTDANAPVMVPGFSMHDELITLTKSGMSNTQALLSATKIPANWMNQRSGIIKKGYRADLILLNKNPLENIVNIRTIDTVIVNGKILNRQKLNAMLNAVKSANNESRSVSIAEFIAPTTHK